VNAANLVAIYDGLRQNAFWKLLAADNAPVVVALLQRSFHDGDARLPASVFYDRLAKDLEDLRGAGKDLPQTPQAYVADWLASGWLSRRFPPGAGEEEFELSGDAARALRLMRGLIEPRRAATESRLFLVIQALDALAKATDPDPESRLRSLLAQREELEERIAAVRSGQFEPLTGERALERTSEIIGLAGELVADFHHVRDDFDRLNRELREQIMEEGASRGQTLEKLFAGIDVIAESEAGRTFYSFWRLLNDAQQSALLEDAVDAIFSREFARQLEWKERRLLQGLVRTLLSQGGGVHEVLQSFARSLRQFVQSREYLEQRLIHRRIREAQQAALQAKSAVKYTEKMPFELTLTSSRIRSLSQWVLFDPSLNAIQGGMSPGGALEIDLETIGSLLAHSEIDFRTLRQNIGHCLKEAAQVSIGDVIAQFPARQGLGSVVGYLVLGGQAGVFVPDSVETVAWVGEDGVNRRARIPLIYFVRDRLHELV
jgi:hypothetical protein